MVASPPPGPLADVAATIDEFFDAVINALEQNLDLNALPVFADAPATGGANALVTSMVADLNNTRAGVQAALCDPTFLLNFGLAATDEDRAAALRAALTTVQEITVTADDPVNPTDIVDFTLGDTLLAMTTGVELQPDMGLDSLGLALPGTADLSSTATYAFDLMLDISDETFFLDASDDPEFTFDLEGDFLFDPAGSFGALDLTVAEVIEDPENPAPNLTLTAAVEIAGGDLDADPDAGTPISAISSGALDLLIDIQTENPEPTEPPAEGEEDEGGNFPNVLTTLSLQFDFPEDDALDNVDPEAALPEVEFRDVGIQIQQLRDFLDGALEFFAGLTSTFPFGTLIDLYNRPIPLVSTVLPNNFPNFRSLIEVWAGDSQALRLLDFLVDVALAADALGQLASDDGLVLGSITVDQDALEQLIAGENIGLDQLLVPSDVQNPDLPAAFDQFLALDGLEIPLLFGGPEVLIELLLNAVGSDPSDPDQQPLADPVTLFQLNAPPVSVGVSNVVGIPIFPPVFAQLGGGVTATADLNFGYSTRGLFDPEQSNLSGFFVGTDPDGGGGFLPVAGLTTEIRAGFGLEFGIAGASISGGIFSDIGINLVGRDDQGRTYLSDIQLPCVFGELDGDVGTDIVASMRFGFGPFSYERTRVLTRETLVNFNLEICDGPHGGSTELVGAALATEVDALADIWQLSMGPFGSDRMLPEGVGVDDQGDPLINEFFVLTAPRDDDGNTLTGVEIRAFGFTEVVGGDDPDPEVVGVGEGIESVIAEAGDGDDLIIVQAELGVNFSLDGGSGNDILIAGELRDTLYGGIGDDSLVGGLGDDQIYGGDGSDKIDGGAGADQIFGGDGIDEVSYENSSVGVTFTPIVLGNAETSYQGQGGDAEGDILSSIEVIIGSPEDDTFFGANAPNRIDANAGDDVLYGGTANDLLLGDAGGDQIYGGDGLDQTSYQLSTAGVQINLGLNSASGGHADGDSLFSIEGVEGSFYNDNLTNGGEDGFLLGRAGDDTLRSVGGAVTLIGGTGDDTIIADGDLNGDVLDGGGFANLLPGRDLLTFRDTAGGVVVNLFNGTAGRPGNTDIDTIVEAQLVDTPPGTFNEVFSPAPGYSTFEDLEGGNGNDTLIGDNGANSILGGNGDDVLYGGNGDDTLIGEAGADALYGGNGADWADYEANFFGITVDLDANTSGGSAAGDSFSSIENVRGTIFADSITGTSGNNRIAPLVSGLGIDRVDGLGGDDVLELRLGGVLTGLDFLQIGENGSMNGATDLTFFDIERVDLDATSLADTIVATGSTDDIYHLRGGNDSVSAGAGQDVIRLGPGNDFVRHDGVADGIAGLPLLWIEGEQGIDRLSIDLGRASDGISLIMGDPNVENPDQAVVVEGTVALTGFEILEDISTGSGNDTLIQPGFVNNTFFTGLGDDFIAPGLGFDVIYGGDPSGILDTDVDILFLDFTFSAADRITSLATADSERNSGFFEGLDPTIDRVDYRNIERIIAIGTSGDDELRGALEFPQIYDGPGNILSGAAGNDTIVGGFQADFLAGGLGGDIIYGGDGDDTVVAGVVGGDDLIDFVFGGAGADLFILGDETGYFYGEPSANPPDNRDGIFVQDFDPVEGDVVQLVGSSDEYTVGELFGSTVLLRGLTGQSVIDAAFIGFTGFDLDAAYVRYIDDPALSLSPEPSASLADTATELVSLLANAGFAAPSVDELLRLAAPDPDAVVDGIRSGALNGAEALAALEEASIAQAPSGAAESAQSPASEDISANAVAGVLDVETTGAEVFLLEQVIRQQVIAATGLTDRLVNITISQFGDPTGFGTFREGFGFEMPPDPNAIGAGVVISTGIADELDSPNLADGSALQTFATEALVPLEFVGRVGDSDILRADVTGLDITEFTLIDANLLEGGSGVFTGSDVDTLFFSTTQFEGNSTAFDSLPALGVMNFSPLGTALALGPQRNGTTSNPLNGTFFGLLDNTAATLETRDYLAGGSPGVLSLGDGGEARFVLDQPLTGTDQQTYLYVAEAGDTEGLYLQIGNDPVQQSAGQVGDLSTDFGVQGPEGDTVGFDVQLNLDADFLPDVTVEVELFQIVVAFESLLELAGTDLQDRFRVRVNGVDALVLRDGSAAQLETLALSPNGVFHPDLIQNPVGTGPLADQLRADGYTAVLTVRAPIQVGGQNTIRIEVEDRGDGLLDTAMFIAAPQIADTFADTISLFDEPSDTLPVGVFNSLAQALNAATNGARIRVGPDAMAQDTQSNAVAVEELTLEVESILPTGLSLAPGIREITLGGTAAQGISGNDEDNTITGNSADNAIDAGHGNDTLLGLAGNDTLSGGAGADMLDGGAGLDIADYTSSSAAVMVFLDSFAMGGDAEGDTLIGIEGISGTGLDDVLFGNAAANILTGAEGRDYLSGGDGNDALFGGDDSDILESGAGNDTLDGGEGQDLLSAFDAVSVVTINLNNMASSSADYAGDLLVSIEGILGSGSFANRLTGTLADDLFIGGNVADRLIGNGGADILLGQAGDDRISGGGGDDVLLTGFGNDTVTTGTGSDVILFALNEANGEGDDVITDFEIGLDLIVFYGTGFAVEDVAVGTAAGSTNALLSYASSSVELVGVTEAEVAASFVFFEP